MVKVKKAAEPDELWIDIAKVLCHSKGDRTPHCQTVCKKACKLKPSQLREWWNDSGKQADATVALLKQKGIIK